MGWIVFFVVICVIAYVIIKWSESENERKELIQGGMHRCEELRRQGASCSSCSSPHKNNKGPDGKSYFCEVLKVSERERYGCCSAYQ